MHGTDRNSVLYTDCIQTGLKMKNVRIEDGIVPLNEFKAKAGRLLKKLREDGEPLVITHNGRPAGVVVSPEEFDRMRAREEFDLEMALAERDIEEGRVMTGDQLRERLHARRTKRGA
jgi:prevent-host-death family protein